MYTPGDGEYECKDVSSGARGDGGEHDHRQELDRGDRAQREPVDGQVEAGRAADALDSIARISRSSLDEVRAVVATLREGEPSYHPAPGLADLPALVETARLAGLTVELTLLDDVEGVPRQAGVAVYRIAREALTNVIRHAHASAASVQVSHRDGRVEVAIRDDGSGSGAGSGVGPTPGHGITGMRERAEALGGTPSAGPAARSGFLVTASLPVGSERSR